jgi:ANTH domain
MLRTASRQLSNCSLPVPCAGTVLRVAPSEWSPVGVGHCAQHGLARCCASNALPVRRELEVDAAGELLTQLTRLGSCLTACVPLRLAAASELVQVALHFLNFEGRHLFMSLAQMQLAVIEKFFDLSPDVAKQVLAPMEASLKQSEELAKYMRFCQQIIHTSSNSTELKVRHRGLGVGGEAPMRGHLQT